MKINYSKIILITVLLSMVGCRDDGINEENEVSGYVYPDNLDQEIRPEELLTGGELGTTFNHSESSYEDPTPAIDNNALFSDLFGKGEDFFEHRFNQNPTGIRRGLGPVYTRSACIDCHPNYGHGKRMDRYVAGEIGNGYLFYVVNKTDIPEEEKFISSITPGMGQTKAVHPFKAPVSEEHIHIDWLPYTDDWGNRFPDGEEYGLIYPEISIDAEGYYTYPLLDDNGNELTVNDVRVKIESSIGFYGIGLIDAIDDKDILEQYHQEAKYAELNPLIFDKATNNWVMTDDLKDSGRQSRYAYVLAGSSIQNAPGSSSLFSVSNIIRADQPKNFITKHYAEVSSKDPEVQKEFYKKFPEWNKTGDVEKDIYNYLMGEKLPVELTQKEFKSFMVWFRGLAVPAARDLNDKDVQLGHRKFREIGCATCHRPSWKTGEDPVIDSKGIIKASDVPTYPHQTIWPYTDLVQHRLHMVNNLRGGWARTTPLWGRGLSFQNTGASDRIHDCRARNVIEAIMWHGHKDSDARFSVEKFRNLHKVERDAIVKFIESI